MKFITKRSLDTEEKELIMVLWNNEYPLNVKYTEVKEFEEYLDKLNDKRHLLVVDNEDVIKGWFVDFIRNEERWFAMVLDGSIQGAGVGSEVLRKAKEQNTELNGWVVNHNKYVKSNGAAYISPIEFYKKNDFKIVVGKELKTDRLSAIKMKWVKGEKAT